MLWIKAFHIIFVVMWFAGLMYLPRLFAYHADTSDNLGRERFKVMERKLFIITTIGCIGAVVLGLWLFIGYMPGFAKAGWMHAKLLLVLLLLIYHGWLWKLKGDFARDANQRSAKFYKMINELPALVLIAAVILVVVKPF